MAPLSSRARWSLRLVAGVHLALLTGVVVAFQVIQPPPPSRAVEPFALLIAAIFALTECHGLLAASWWTLGRARFWRRTMQTAGLSLVLAGLYFIVIISSNEFRLDDVGDSVFGAMMFAFTPLLLGSLPLWIARRYRWRWLDETTPPIEPVQFSITQTLLTTVLLAVLFALARFAYLRADAAAEWLERLSSDSSTRKLYEVISFILAMSSFFASGWLGVAACAGPRPRASLIVATLLAGCLLGQGAAMMAGKHADEGFSGVLGVGPPLTAALTIATLLALRAGELRIDREPLPASASAAAAASTGEPEAESPVALPASPDVSPLA